MLYELDEAFSEFMDDVNKGDFPEKKVSEFILGHLFKIIVLLIDLILLIIFLHFNI